MNSCNRCGLPLSEYEGHWCRLNSAEVWRSHPQQVRDIKDDSPDIDRLISQIQKWGSSR